MDIDNLNCFINVAECLNFAQAAKQLYVSQSSLSNRIAALEKELGVSLFERTTRSVTLTAAGEFFLTEAKSITKRVGEVALRTRELAAGSQGSLNVGYLDFLGYDVMERAVMNYHRDYPDISLSILKLNYPTLLKNLNDMNVDVALMVLSIESLPQVLQGKPILSSRMKLLMRKDHPLASQSSVKLSKIKDEALLSVEKESAELLNNTISHMFARQGLIPKITKECFGPEELAIAVSSGMGIAIVSDFMQASMKKSENLCMVPISHILDTCVLSIISHRDNPNACIRSFMDSMQKTAVELSEENPDYSLL